MPSTKSSPTFDRSEEDVGNVISLEHVNTVVPDQHLATLFYFSGLGLTREPYLMPGTENMWVNVGRSQFHLGPHNKPQVVRGRTGLVIPGRQALLRRLAGVKDRLAQTRFAYEEHEDYVETTCPWGNRIRVHEPDARRFGRIRLGIPYVEFDVPGGTAAPIARFYDEGVGAPSKVEQGPQGAVARVMMGANQALYFRETEAPLPEYDGHHIQIYIINFSRPHRWLKERGLITEESHQHQYRFKDLKDPETGKLLYTLEHEVRSIRHPLYDRPLVNRNPMQSNMNYAPGHDAMSWGMSHEE